MTSQKSIYFYTFLAVLLWSTVASAFKITLRYISPVTLVFFATVSSTFTLFLMVVLQGKFGNLKNLTTPEIRNAALKGLLNPFLYYIVLFKAYDLLPAQQAQPLNYTWPIFLSILSFLVLKHPFSKRQITALLISFCGVVIISTRGQFTGFQSTNLPGIILGLSSAVIWSFYWLINMRARGKEPENLALSFLFGSMYTFIIYVCVHGFTLPVWQGLAGAVYVGMFEMGITFFLWAKALRLAPSPASISNYIYLVPFISLIWIRIIVGEEILPATFIGLLLIITGILLQKKDTR